MDCVAYEAVGGEVLVATVASNFTLPLLPQVKYTLCSRLRRQQVQGR